MPEISVKITKGETEVSSNFTEVTSNSLSHLISTLKTSKAETNAILTKLVDEQKNKNVQEIKEATEEDESDETDGDEPSKKQKIQS